MCECVCNLYVSADDLGVQKRYQMPRVGIMLVCETPLCVSKGRPAANTHPSSVSGALYLLEEAVDANASSPKLLRF